MKRLAAALLLLLVALPAWGATKYVAQTARLAGTGADSANAMSLATFNTGTRAAGDVAILLGGVYTTSPTCQSNAGTMAAPIVYRGIRPGVNSDVVFNTGLSMGDHSYYADSNVVWRDMTFRGDVGFGSTSAHFKLLNVRIIDGGVKLTAVRDSRLDSVACTILATTQSGIQLLTAGGVRCLRDTIRNSSFAVDSAGGTGSSATNVFTGTDNFYESVRCSTQTTTNPANLRIRFTRFSETVGGIAKDCYFWGKNNTIGGGSDEPMNFSFKDGVQNFKFYRDTVIITGTSVSTCPAITLAQSESSWPIGNNTFRSCYISNQTNSDYGIIWLCGFDGDSLVGNTFVAQRGTAASYAHGTQVGGGSTYIDHNLFASFARDTAAFTANNVSADEKVYFTNNIFYNPKMTAVGDTTTHRLIHYGDASYWSAFAGPMGANYNLGWMPALATKRVVWYYTPGHQFSAFGMAPWLSFRGFTMDSASQYGRATFTDSTLTGFDAHPTKVSGVWSAAIGFGPAGYVGPYDTLSAPVTTWNVVASAGSHGSILPTGTTAVVQGYDQAYTFFPDSDYYVSAFLVDSVAQDIQDGSQGYVFTNVVAAHTISVSFTHNPIVTVTAGAGGSASPTKSVPMGGTYTVVIIPDPGYRIALVTINGVPSGTVASHTFDGVTVDQTIEVTFEVDPSPPPATPPHVTVPSTPNECNCRRK